MSLVQLTSTGGDDSTAFQNALNSASAVQLIPGPNLTVTHPLNIPARPITILGFGSNVSVVNHAFDGRMFNLPNAAGLMSFHDFGVVSTTAKTPGSHVIWAPGGVSKSKFSGLRLSGDSVAHAPAGLFDCIPSSWVDTVEFFDNQIEGCLFKVYGIGQGAEVRFRAGRIIGGNITSSMGIHLYGNNGGVHIDGTDIIQLGCGLYVSKQNGISNREIFLGQATIDSCAFGLIAVDGSYISWQGVWASSCNEANINLDGTFNGILELSGGTIFNAGANGGSNKDGLVINGPCTVTTDGVIFRDNRGIAVRCPNGANPTSLTLQDSKLLNNGTALSAGGSIELIDNEWKGNGTNAVENGIKYTVARGNYGLAPTALNPSVN